MISEHSTHWLGFPVQLFDAARSEEGVTDYSGTIHRLALDWDATVDFPTLFSRFLDNPASAQAPMQAARSSGSSWKRPMLRSSQPLSTSAAR